MAQGRRVRRVVRTIETGSVLKFAVLFWASVVAVFILAMVILWSAAASVGAIDNIEKLMQDQGFDDFEFLPSQMLRGLILGGLVMVLLGSFLTVLMAVVYNLISDVVGGIRLVVIEEVGGTEPKERRWAAKRDRTHADAGDEGGAGDGGGGDRRSTSAREVPATGATSTNGNDTPQTAEEHSPQVV